MARRACVIEPQSEKPGTDSLIFLYNIMAIMTKEEFRAERRRAKKDIDKAKSVFAKLLESRVKELNENTYKEYIGKKVEITISLRFFKRTFKERGFFSGVYLDCLNRIVVELANIKKDGTRSARGITRVEEDYVTDVKIIE